MAKKLTYNPLLRHGLQYEAEPSEPGSDTCRPIDESDILALFDGDTDPNGRPAAAIQTK